MFRVLSPLIETWRSEKFGVLEMSMLTIKSFHRSTYAVLFLRKYTVDKLYSRLDFGIKSDPRLQDQQEVKINLR